MTDRNDSAGEQFHDLTTGSSRGERVLRGAIFLFGAIIIASLVLNVVLTHGGFHNHPRYALGKMIYGEADRPFVYRAGAPALIRVVTQLTPVSVRDRIAQVWDSRDIGRVWSMDSAYSTEGTWAIVIMFVSLVGFALAMREFLRTCYRVPPLIAVLAPLAALTCVPVFRSFYIYDFPNLLIFTVALTLLVRGNWRRFYPLFIVACFIKETAVLLPFVFLVTYYRRTGKRVPWIHIGVQSAIWLVIFAGIRYLFNDNPGHFLEFHLFDYNLPALVHWHTYFDTNYYLMPENFNIFLLVAAVVLIGRNWSSKPFFLRRALLMLVPLLVLAMVFACIDETRMYLEVYPVMFLLGFHSVMKLFRCEFEVLPSTGSVS